MFLKTFLYFYIIFIFENYAAVDVWTIRDPEKRKTAEINNLNYLEIFTNDLETAISELKKRLNIL